MEVKILTKDAIYVDIKNRIIHAMSIKPKIVLGLATGSSPIGVYDELIKAYKAKEVSFKDATSFNLDEYIGIDSNNPQSYRYFMNEHLFNHIDIDIKRTHIPSMEEKSHDYYRDYDLAIKKAGGIDFQILGIGSNGHIAFNEPGTSFDSTTHIVSLQSSTIKDNSRFFKSIEEVPTKAVSMGLKSIMNAREIVIIVTGKNKANALKKLVTDDELDEQFPASILKKHPHVTVYADKEAASLL